jgi:hypothetical protein
MNEPRPSLIFISHHSSQAALARQLKDRLAGAGIDGWMAPDDIDPGLSFDQAIIEQVARSDGIVLLFCSNSDMSRHVKRELILGEESGKPIYPVRLEKVMPKGLTYWLQDYQWIDWLGGKGTGVDRLIATIRRNAGAGDDSTPTGTLAGAAPSPRSGRKRVLIAGIAAALVALVIAGYFLLRPKPETTATAQSDFVISPGKWISRRDVVEIVYPQVEPQMARQMEQVFENDPDPEECIAPEVARTPGVGLFDPGGAGRCALTSFSMSDGRMSGYLSCPLPGVSDGSVMQVTFRGQYTRTSIDLENDITISRPGSITRLRARDTSRYVGPACSGPQPPAQRKQ